MKVSLEEIKNASHDARIKLTTEEEKDLLKQLENLWSQIEKINSERLDPVQDTHYALKQQNTLRKDLLKPSLPQNVVLKNAPDADETCFRVPKIIDQ